MESDALWIVVKASRRGAETGYCGPTCALVGVEPGGEYDCKLAATLVAARLSMENPVGFVVQSRSNVAVDNAGKSCYTVSTARETLLVGGMPDSGVRAGRSTSF